MGQYHSAGLPHSLSGTDGLATCCRLCKLQLGGKHSLLHACPRSYQQCMFYTPHSPACAAVLQSMLYSLFLILRQPIWLLPSFLIYLKALVTPADSGQWRVHWLTIALLYLCFAEEYPSTSGLHNLATLASARALEVVPQGDVEAGAEHPCPARRTLNLRRKCTWTPRQEPVGDAHRSDLSSVASILVQAG